MTARSPRIVVVGSANMDLVVKVDRLPARGETILGGEFMTAAGGKGANQAVAAARLGAAVAMVGRVGTDDMGERLLQGLQNEGVDITQVRRDDSAASGVAMIAVGPRGENFIIVAPGANARLSPDDVDEASHLIEGADAVLLQLEIPLATVQRAVETAHRAGVAVVLNPAPARDLPPQTLSKVSLLTPDESEASLLAGVPITDVAQARVASLRLLELGPRAVVITLGPDGALLASDNAVTHLPAFPVEPVDTTAAGDAFNAAMAVALARGESMIQAVRFANAVGALATTVMGAQPSMPHQAAVDQFIQQYR